MDGLVDKWANPQKQYSVYKMPVHSVGLRIDLYDRCSRSRVLQKRVNRSRRRLRAESDVYDCVVNCREEVHASDVSE